MDNAIQQINHNSEDKYCPKPLSLNQQVAIYPPFEQVACALYLLVYESTLLKLKVEILLTRGVQPEFNVFIILQCQSSVLVECHISERLVSKRSKMQCHAFNIKLF